MKNEGGQNVHDAVKMEKTLKKDPRTHATAHFQYHKRSVCESMYVLLRVLLGNICKYEN